MQISYVYVAKVSSNTKELHLTKQEKDEGAELCWYKPEIALKKINDSYGKLLPSKYSDLYNSKIIIKRDYSILKFYIQNNVKNLCTQQLTSNVYTIFE